MMTNTMGFNSEGISKNLLNDILQIKGINNLEPEEIAGIILSITDRKAAISALKVFKNYSRKKELGVFLLEKYGAIIIPLWKLEYSAKELYSNGIKYGSYELFKFVKKKDILNTLKQYFEMNYSFLKILSPVDIEEHPKPILCYIPKEFHSDDVVRSALKLDMRNAKYIRMNEQYALILVNNFGNAAVSLIPEKYLTDKVKSGLFFSDPAAVLVHDWRLSDGNIKALIQRCFK